MIFADISKSETPPSPTSAIISILIPPPPLKSADVVYGRSLTKITMQILHPIEKKNFNPVFPHVLSPTQILPHNITPSHQFSLLTSALTHSATQSFLERRLK